ncbi:MAG: type V CRISPR-associated protein Cas12b [Desulfobacteraceae bacterium]|nr:type V CRISPR-associated protein Cas12b [Desulfobacteraceae bacterium]
MKRIYQGKVTKVETLEQGSWKELPDWKAVLWRHHELFQDAVNYYTLALAALADSIEGNDDKSEAIKAWVARVKESWEQANRKAITFPGPHKRIASLLKIDPEKTGVNECLNAILQKCRADKEKRGAAIVKLLEEANKAGDLSQLCVGCLPWLCTGKGKLKATPDDVAAKQAACMNEIIIKVHECGGDDFDGLAGIVDPGFFLTNYPAEEKQHAEEGTVKLAMKYFDDLIRKKHPEWQSFRDEFKAAVEEKARKYPLRDPGRKTKGAFPYAVIFRYCPSKEIWEAFKKSTQSIYKAAKKGQNTGSATADPLAILRVDDEPPFDYFSNITMVGSPGGKEKRAVWFEYDLAAFVEAIKSPHRFYQDTQKRKEAITELRKKLEAMKGQGGKIDAIDEEEPGEYFGFERDKRIDLIRKLVTYTLGYLGEVNNPEDASDGGKIEYSISERTLRGFSGIKAQWRKLLGKNKSDESALLEVLAAEQTSHRDDFGSAALYRQLAKPEFQPIWRDAGSEPWHADDPLNAWLNYKKIQYELADKERSIRFTPAHAIHSPRYFIFPKTSSTSKKESTTRKQRGIKPSLLSKHIACTNENIAMQFTAGIVIRNAQRHLQPVPVRFTYSAPRLRRDRLRGNAGEDLFAVPWVQPMIAALGLSEPDRQNFANTRITLMPNTCDSPRYGEREMQLIFPVDANSDNLRAHVANGLSWDRQFNWGGGKTLSSLRWPYEEKPKKSPPQWWWEMTDMFSGLSVDLGQRDAGAFARLEIVHNQPAGTGRFIGETEGKKWFASVSRLGLFRLPGEDAVMWREASKKDKTAGPAFRAELSGEKGRRATADETDDASDLFRAFGVEEKDLMPDNWRNVLSFPEQNDKLLVAARRSQSRLARLHRWAWFFGDANNREAASNEISESNIWELAKLTKDGKQQELAELIPAQIHSLRQTIPGLLVRLANRILPLRGRSWEWKKHPQKTDCFILEQTGPAIQGIRIRGQRGISMERIEQISELRRRFQSLNQALRREIGKKAPARRDDSIPDCCPDLLDKLERIKEQRINQTAHLILSEALGLELAVPPGDKKMLREKRDVHGQYLQKRSPASFIVIEDLSRYRASQGRAPRENSRLMKWCHRAVRDKLKELCEPFGIPVLETPAAYSSRFCSRSGVAGFRAMEIAPGFENKAPWYWLKDNTDKDGNLTKESVDIRETIFMLADFNADNPIKPRTLILPIAGGPIFVPISDQTPYAEFQPAIVQADINAAINLGLRAISDPREWSIHPRLRTAHKSGQLFAREKRKFGANAVAIRPIGDTGKEKDDVRNPNYFADFANCAGWGRAVLENEEIATPLVSGKALWGTVKAKQWDRCKEINWRRLDESQKRNLKNNKEVEKK